MARGGTPSAISLLFFELVGAIKANQCNMNSEYSNSEPIKLSRSSYTILCHKINSVEGHCPLTDSFVIYKSLVCIKFLQIIVIFPECPQSFTWGESQNPWEGRGHS